MLKTISAALLAVSVFAAPALAAGQAKSTQAPVTKTEQVKKVKPNALNASAKMNRHKAKHVRRHGHGKHMGAVKTHKVSKVTIKHIGQATKRG
jgi:hypothetical protein